MVDQQWPTYAVVQVLLSYPYCHAIVVAWVSRNSNNVGTRSVSAALYNVSSTGALTEVTQQTAPRVIWLLILVSCTDVRSTRKRSIKFHIP